MKSSTLCHLILAISLCAPVFAYDWSTNPGNGSIENPYQISEPNQLVAIDPNEYMLSQNYVLVNDIDLAQYSFTEAVIAPEEDYSAAFYQGPGFSGTFDGAGYKINNLKIDTKNDSNSSNDNYDYFGLFGQIADSGRVKNVRVENVMITVLRGQYAGGICANNYGRITNCGTAGVISGSSYMGGLCGCNYGVIDQCYSTAEVSGWGDCGGLCGASFGYIGNCYATGNVTGDSYYIGGLCGYQVNAVINCYSTGRVSSIIDETVGGLCGINVGKVKDSYWDWNSSGQITSYGGWGKSSSEMKDEATYLGWNNGYWVIENGYDTPRLEWEGTPGTLISTDYPPRTYSGNGSSIPFQISTPEDLRCMALRTQDLYKSFELTCNIDMSAVSDYRPPTNFIGIFDGHNYTISNLSISSAYLGNNSNLGLFGLLSSNGTIENLILEDIYIYGTELIGGLCGHNSRGTIKNCSVTGLVEGSKNASMVGGLIGRNDGTISNCSSDSIVMVVDSSSYIGGFCGWNQEDIEQSVSTGNVIGGKYSYDLGGFCGITRDYIADCFYIGKVETGNNSTSIGGLTGSNSGDIRNCYSTADVVVGADSKKIGGLCGENYRNNAAIMNCFWDIEIQTAGVSNSIGENNQDAVQTNVFAKTTSEMQTITTYTDYGWDFTDETQNGFEDIWKICQEPGCYPKFPREFDRIGDFLCPAGVATEDLSYLSQYWLQSDEKADLNGDGIVNLLDFEILAQNWIERDSEQIGPDGMVWIYIDDPGLPGHEPFKGYMSKYEVTNDQYCQYLNTALSDGLITVYRNKVYASNDTGHTKSYCRLNLGYSRYQITFDGSAFSVITKDNQFMGNHPIVAVSWYGANAFCKYYGLKLPTQSQWQAVADYDGTFIYGCGTTIYQSKANYYLGAGNHCNPLNLSQYPYTTPVGYYGNDGFGYGMCDMAGNANEWTSSTSGVSHIFIGGDWNGLETYCEVYRGFVSSDSVGIGFRPCR